MALRKYLKSFEAPQAPHFFFSQPPKNLFLFPYTIADSAVFQMGAKGGPKVALLRRARETPPMAAVPRFSYGNKVYISTLLRMSLTITGAKI